MEADRKQVVPAKPVSFGDDSVGMPIEKDRFLRIHAPCCDCRYETGPVCRNRGIRIVPRFEGEIDLGKIDENFIGGLGTTEYYLIYKGNNRNDLNKSFLKKIKDTDNKKVIYADRCLIDDDTLIKNNIVFKQIPYEVKVY